MKISNAQDILREAQENLTLCGNAEREIREEAKRCNKFLALKQWEQADLDVRGSRVTVVIDQLGQYRDQVVNSWRRNRLGIKCSPGDDIANDKTARIYDGLVRQIEYVSKAQVAYDHAFECMVGGNRGFTQVGLKRRKGSFKQQISIIKIPNPESVYLDPFAENYEDRRFALKIENVSRKQFKKDYPKASITDFSGVQGNLKSWFPTEDTMILCEYWRVEESPRKIQQLSAPIAVVRKNRVLKTDVVYDNEYDELPDGVEVMVGPDGQPLEDDEPERQVICYLLNGAEVLDRTEWLGHYIPIIEWAGKEIWYDGKKNLFSVISRSLDAQKVFNYSMSQMAERLGQSTRSPIIGMIGQFKTMAKEWAESAVKAFAFLGYDPVAVGDKLAPPPQRADFDPRIDQAVAAAQLTKDNLRGTIGINTAVLGQDVGKAKSGVAIRELAKSGDNATFDFHDNGGRAIEEMGCLIVDLIPEIYSEPELIQIRDEQQRTISVAINQDLKTMENPPEGQDQSHFLTEGEYQVMVSASPSHQSIRQEGQEMMMDMFQAMPDEIKAKMMPTMLRLSDWFGAKEIADSVDPPQDGKANTKQMGMALQQMKQVVEAQTAELQKLLQEREAKTLELESQERRTAIQVWGQIEVAKVKTDSDEEIAELDRNADQLKQAFDQAHQVGMAAANMAVMPQEPANEPATA